MNESVHRLVPLNPSQYSNMAIFAQRPKKTNHP